MLPLFLSIFGHHLFLSSGTRDNVVVVLLDRSIFHSIDNKNTLFFKSMRPLSQPNINAGRLTTKMRSLCQIRDGPLENLWGGGRAKYKKKIRARENEMKKNSCTPINPKKYSCNGLNKIHAKNLITKKNSCSSKIPLPPHNFSNGPSLMLNLSRQLRTCIIVVLNQSTSGTISSRRAGVHFRFDRKRLNPTVLFYPRVQGFPRERVKNSSEIRYF